MLQPIAQRYPTMLFWLLVAQLCVISISIAAASVLLAAAILLLIVWSLAVRRTILPRTPLDLFIVAYIVAELVTALWSVDSSEAFRNAKRLFLLSIVYAVVLVCDSRAALRRAVMIIAGAVALQSLGEIYAYVALAEDRLHLFQHYMTTGGIKMIVCLMLLPGLVDPAVSRKERLLLIAISVPVFVALLLTNTRSSWLGFVAGVTIVGLLQYRRLLIGLALLVVLFFLFAPTHQVDRAKSIVDMSQPSNYGRIHMWETGLKIWLDHPVLGTGDIDLHRLYEQYKQPDDQEYGGHLHNNFVHLFVTLGLVGFIVVMALWWKIWSAESAIHRRSGGDREVRNAALGSMAVFTGFLVNGFFEWNFGDHEIMVFVWFSVGLALAAGRLPAREEP